MFKYKGMLVVISGPSGVGKGTICSSIIKRKIDNVELSVSVTTRKPRAGENDGVSYYFKDKSRFEEMITKGEFLEYACVYGNYYGTPKEYVLNKLAKGINVILEIDIQGAMQVKRNFGEGTYIFIMPPSFKELKKRIINRGTESKEDIKKRLNSAFEEVKEVVNYDYMVINDSVKKAADEIIYIINAERSRVSRYKIDFEKFKEEYYD